jgi:predicted Zn-dependent protease
MVKFAAIGLTLLASSAYADIFRPSKEDQVKLGQKAAADIKKQEKLLPESHIQVKTLRRIALKLLSTVDDSKEPWKYSFDVIHSKTLNAFALPGGPVFFYSGIMNKMKTEDEIAGILAHELTHVRHQHWATAYAESQKRALGISALLTIFKVNRTGAAIASITNDLLIELPFSRSHETDSDMTGLTMMVNAGYNPNGMADVFRMLKAEGGSKPPEFLSTHPDDGKRINNIEDKIKKMNRTFPAMKPLPSGWIVEDPKK